MTLMKTLAATAFLILAIAACGKTPAQGCADLCTGAGFSDNNLDEQPNELNCFCTGGTGAVSDEACTTMCTDLGKSNAEAFSSTGGENNSCQCS